MISSGLYRALFPSVSRTRQYLPDGIFDFVNSTLGRYLVYLIFCDFVQGLAFTMNFKWASSGSITEGAACTVQGQLSPPPPPAPLFRLEYTEAANNTGTFAQIGDMGAVFWYEFPC